MKKILSTVLATALLASALAGCGGGEKPADKPADQGGTTTPPATVENKDVKVLTNVTGGKDDDEMKLFQEALSKSTGLNVTLEKPPTDYGKVMMQKLQGGEIYDLIYLGADQVYELNEQEALMDLTDMVKASPILSDTSIIPQSEWDDITIDGKIYAGFNKLEVQRVVALNNAHLKGAGIDYKTIAPTLDGYYDVFKKLRAANSASDYYPLNIVLSESYDLQPWFAAEGIKSGIVIADGKRTVPMAEDASIPVWEWLKKLYAEKLLDPSCAIDKTKDMRPKLGSGANTTVNVDWAAWVGIHNNNARADGKTAEQFEIVSLPGVQTPDGKYMLVKGNASLWAVPVNAANPAGALKLMEFFATQEGGDLLSAGIEGHDYTVEADGSFKLTDIGAKHSKDHGAPIPVNQKYEHKAGMNEGLEEALSYLEYASIEMIDAKHTAFKETCGKWGVAIVKGETPVAEGLASMKAELKSLGVID